MAELPRPFLLHLADGRVWQGAVFEDGFVIVHHPFEANVCTIAVSLPGLLDVRPAHHLHAARVEWADGGAP